MAKRKRRPGKGIKLGPPKDYRDDQYVVYINRAEIGILQAWTIDPDLRDGDVREALRELMRSIKKAGQLPKFLTQKQSDDSDEESGYQANSLLEHLILTNLRDAFEKYGPLNAEDTIGILKVINNSVGSWNRGMQGQEYLKYIKDFLGGMGIEVRELTEEEVEMLDLEPGDDSIEGEYREIK